jgi:hypothetical protein
MIVLLAFSIICFERGFVDISHFNTTCAYLVEEQVDTSSPKFGYTPNVY